ncbi:hypothetical protein EC9_23870 [Rosistilla ulvae]|uniref:Uncharacterized protein n=1 Tax=Rosistilla ulvae TaxID=1930277 RepID=A0A517M012_9BACT|nr:hypothetical protein EC9_23870 [Rosistilla ulvae]
MTANLNKLPRCRSLGFFVDKKAFPFVWYAKSLGSGILGKWAMVDQEEDVRECRGSVRWMMSLIPV